MNAGVRNPRRSVLICAGLLAASVAVLVFGIARMILAGAETQLSTFSIVLGAVGSIAFFFLLLNFTWGMRVIAAIRRGENVIARWTVPAEAVDRFRRNEANHAAEGHPNDYKLPGRTPPQGLEVIFATDGVVIGDTFFGLATTGLANIRQAGIVPGEPLCLGFRTSITTGRIQSSGTPRIRNVLGLLRIPVADSAHAQAKTVLDHYIAALAGQVVVKPDFWHRRIRWGLWAAVVSAVVAAAGFSLAALGADLGELPLILAVSGTVAAIGGLLLALIAWGNAGRQRQGRGNAPG